MPKMCHNRILVEYSDTYELRYNTIQLVQTFYLKDVPAKFKKYFKHLSGVISGTSLLKLSCSPSHPSRNISCNHRDSKYFLHQITRKQGSTVTSAVIKRLLPLTTVYLAQKMRHCGFVRAHLQKYWNALTVRRGHDDDGYSCTHRVVSPVQKPDMNNLSLLQVE